jgi:hypothetical protein
VLFTRSDIEDGLRSLVEELAASGVTSRIQVVGGAAIILQADREVLTSDVDTLHWTTSGIEAAVERVAQARRWPSNWLNDAANMWASHYDTEDDWDIRFHRDGVSVLVARAPLLLAMKLHAGRGRRDAEDIDLLLGSCGIETFGDAVAVFDRYYPVETISPKALRQLHDRFDDSAET